MPSAISAVSSSVNRVVREASSLISPVRSFDHSSEVEWTNTVCSAMGANQRNSASARAPL